MFVPLACAVAAAVVAVAWEAAVAVAAWAVAEVAQVVACPTAAPRISAAVGRRFLDPKYRVHPAAALGPILVGGIQAAAPVARVRRRIFRT